MQTKQVKAILVLIGLFWVTFASAHEYWLSPVRYETQLGQKALIEIKNGEDFAGSSFPYEGARFESLYLLNSAGKQAIKSRLGDFPAIHPTLTTAGLHAVVLSSTPKHLVYAEWEKFADFLDYHGLLDFIQAHKDKELPTTDIREQYYRFAKTFIHAEEGSNKSTSQWPSPVFEPQEQELELVFMSNPYSRDGSLVVKLLHKQSPLANRQVELFTRNDEVTRVITQTDEQGIAKFSNVRQGIQMLNAVHLIEPDDSAHDWKTLWASVTFATK